MFGLCIILDEKTSHFVVVVWSNFVFLLRNSETQIIHTHTHIFFVLRESMKLKKWKQSKKKKKKIGYDTQLHTQIITRQILSRQNNIIFL